jgi:DNA-binding MarR family transcriptional regulator
MTSKYSKDLANILQMLRNIEEDLNLINYTETEKKIYYTIACKIADNNSCRISDVINESGFSRSTVYKTIKKFEYADLIKMYQSSTDKREFNLVLT